MAVHRHFATAYKPTKNEKELFGAVLKLKNLSEAQKFFRDLLTINEIEEFSKRFQIAKLVYQGELTYQEIAKRLQTSTATVTRVAGWLKGGENGYRLILRRLFGSSFLFDEK